ncbi:MAG: CotH kinase family protein [Jiangellales bacterium]
MRENRRRAVVAWTSLLAVGGLMTGCSPSLADSTATSVEQSLVTDAGTVFDDAVVHSFELDIDDEAVRDLLETYQATGDKEWTTAGVTIDGETFDDVGVRLKGNSSLRDVDLDADPAELPWLIRLDKYVDGQNLDGYSSFIVRSNTTETSLNEAVALDLLEMAGLASEQAVAVRFSVADGEEQLRLVVQNLDETWEAENFDSAGALYKAESTGDYSYRGDDPDAYDDVFDQETGDTDDLGPLIDFLDFVNTSSDEEFAAGLADWLDVDSFATYLAFEDLVGNFDDIDGPGNNSYLRWDADAEQFTVVAWDHNLAFGIQPGGGGPLGGAPPEGADGLPPTPGGDGVANSEPPRLSGDQATPGASQGMPSWGDNPLVERYLQVDEFSDRVEAATDELTDRLVSSGAGDDVLQTWVAVIADGASDLVDQATLTTETEAVAAYVTDGP